MLVKDEELRELTPELRDHVMSFIALHEGNNAKALESAIENVRMVGEDDEDPDLILYADSITEWSDFDSLHSYEVHLNEIFN